MKVPGEQSVHVVEASEAVKRPGLQLEHVVEPLELLKVPVPHG